MRDFLRGTTFGVLLATGILAFVYYTTPKEVIVTENTENEYSTDSAIAYLEEQGYEVAKKDVVEQDVSEEENESTDPEEVEEQEDTVEEEAEESTEETVKAYQLVIESGMSSVTVSNLLYENGIVDDARAFDSYLVNHGYQSVIRPGTYDVNEQMSYEEIAIQITN